MIQISCPILDEEGQIFQDHRAGHTACEDNERQLDYSNGKCYSLVYQLVC